MDNIALRMRDIAKQTQEYKDKVTKIESKTAYILSEIDHKAKQGMFEFYIGDLFEGEGGLYYAVAEKLRMYGFSVTDLQIVEWGEVYE